MSTSFFFQVLALSQAIHDVIGGAPEHASTATKTALLLADTMAHRGVPLPDDARQSAIDALCTLASDIGIHVEEVGRGVVSEALEIFEDIFLERQRPAPSTRPYRRGRASTWKR